MVVMDHPSPFYMKSNIRVCIWSMLCLVLHATSSSWCHALDASTLLTSKCHHRIIVSPTIPRPLQQALRFLSLIYNQISFLYYKPTPYAPCPYSLCTPIYINLFSLPSYHRGFELSYSSLVPTLHHNRTHGNHMQQSSRRFTIISCDAYFCFQSPCL